VYFTTARTPSATARRDGLPYRDDISPAQAEEQSYSTTAGESRTDWDQYCIPTRDLGGSARRYVAGGPTRQAGPLRLPASWAGRDGHHIDMAG